MTKVQYDYVPTIKQTMLHGFTGVDEILFGGASGGGKSRAGRAEAIRMATLVPGSLTYVFRRTFPQLQQDVIPKFRVEMPRGLAKYNSSDHTWYFTNGSRIVLGHMQNEADYENYLSSEPQLIVWEELTQFTEMQYRMMRGRLRAAGPVLDRMNQLGWICRSLGTTNPGGVGHAWCKSRFVDPGVINKPWRPANTDEERNPGLRVFIPAKLEDNPHMDPTYEQRLDNLDPIMRRAYRDGDWDILKGVRFPQFRRSLHVVEPGAIPVDFIGHPMAVGVDYGLVDPWCALWGIQLNDGLIYVYRELYGPGYTAAQQARMIKDAEMDGERMPHRPLPIVMDPSMWKRSSEQVEKNLDPSLPPVGSVAWYYRKEFGAQIQKARNERISGWAQIDELLRVREDGLPRLIISSACTNLIRELPAQQRHKTNPEDLQATGEGHADAADALRYLCMQLARNGNPRVTPGLVSRSIAAPITAGVGSQQF